MSSPRQAPAGAPWTPAASATATPKDTQSFSIRKGFNSKRRTDDHGQKRERRKRERATGSGRISQRDVVEYYRNSEEYDTKTGDTGPILTSRPANPCCCYGQHNEKSESKPERAKCNRVGTGCEIARHRRGTPAHAAGDHSHRDTDRFAHQGASACSVMA
jgi:hypothetical protein